MSEDVSLAVQQAVVAVLKADAVMAATVDGRVFDDVPPDAVFPYVCLTGWQHVPDEVDCFDVSEFFFDVQCFSRRVGRIDVGKIAAAVRKALSRTEISIDTGESAIISHRGTNYFTEPDGLTQRAILNFIVTSDQF